MGQPQVIGLRLPVACPSRSRKLASITIAIIGVRVICARLARSNVSGRSLRNRLESGESNAFNEPDESTESNKGPENVIVGMLASVVL